MKATLRLALILMCFVVIPGFAAADDPAPCATITWPQEGLTIATDRVEVRVAYAASGDAVVEQVNLVVDGRLVDAREITPPQVSGSLSFVWAAGSYADGNHDITVSAVDSLGKTGEQTISVRIARGQAGLSRGIRIAAPQRGETVAGRTTIQVESDEPALVRYVIFLVDDVFKAMSNVQPYTYLWDTSRYLNGLHELKAKVYLSGGEEALSPTVEVRVDNPSGATTVREPAASRETVVAAEPPSGGMPARAGEATMPPPMHTESPTPMRPTITVAKAEVGLPGTAPFVSGTGELIRPPSPIRAEADARVAPMEIALLSGGTGEVAASETGPARTTVARPAVASPFEVPQALACDGGQAEACPCPGSRPSGLGTAMAVGGADLATDPTVSPAEGLLSGRRSAGAELPPQVAPLPAEVPAPASIGPPARSMVESRPQPVSATVKPVEEALRPAASGVEIAMLPPWPAEQSPAPKVTAEPTPGPSVYVVQPGDWLWAIAANYGLSPQELARANNLSDPGVIHPGQRLTIPAPLHFDGRPVAYVVQPGDWLWAVAANYGLSPKELARANNLSDPSLIHPGQRLTIPTPLYFDDRPLASEVPAVIVNGEAIVPFRAVIEQAGGSVIWKPADRRASAVARGHEITVTIGSDTARVDRNQVAMGAPAALRRNRTVVPLRFLGDALDLAIQYQGGAIHIASVR